MKFLSASLNDTARLAELVSQQVIKGDVIAFTGGMGAGKTTFTRSLVKALGYSGDVSSPTFTLINEYLTENFHIYHFDFYRITDPDDLYSTGYYDYLDGENILIIEWSENITEELPSNVITVEINRISDTEREFIINGGDRFENIRN